MKSRIKGSMKVYIAGPISIAPEIQIPKFYEAEERLRAMGHEPRNPAWHGHHDYKPWEEYLKEAIHMLIECDAIYLLPDWECSKGATLERTIAKELSMDFICDTKNI